MPSTRSLAGSASLAALLAAAGVAAGQSPGVETGFGLGTEIALRFVGAFLIQLLLAGAAVALGPRYVRGRVDEIRTDAGSAFVWGLLVSVGLPIGLVVIALTVIGLLVTIPGLILVAIVGLVGQAVAVVWIGSLVADDGGDGPGGKAAAVGALVLAVPAAIPLLGNLVTTVVGFFGTGVVGRRLYESWRE